MNLGDLIWEAIFPLINPPLVMGILFFGQDRLAHFLHHERDSMSLKLMSRCIHEDPACCPRTDDRPQAIELAERYSYEDLLPSLHG